MDQAWFEQVGRQEEMMSDGLKLLRTPFPANQIGKLAKGSKAQTQCPNEEKRNCNICGGWHHPKMIHLDYVGHAALTDRLLDADPGWFWEPLALRDGLPAFDSTGGLWIRLTVCGVTRLGYGNAEESQYKEVGSREKEVIGDALRNAAMRFGAALELWHKGDLHADEEKSEEFTRTDVMKVSNSIIEHYAQGREMGAFQEWELIKDNHEFAKAVWARLPTPERDKIRAEQQKLYAGKQPT